MNFILIEKCVLVEIVVFYSGSEKDKFVPLMRVVIQKKGIKKKVEIDKKMPRYYTLS